MFPAVNMNIPVIDLVIIITYLLGIMFVGLWVGRKTDKQTSDTYFLAGRNLRWPVVGAALFASNISTIHLVGLAEGGYKHGLVIGNFEWMATFTLIILALVFAPFYFRTRISTLPEFLEKRYSPVARTLLAIMFIMSALLIHIGISLYAGAAVFQQFFGINVYASIVIISVVTAVYTVVGGLRAVVVTETIQAVILLLGAVVVTLLALFSLPEVGIDSLSALKEATREHQLSMLHTSNEEGYAWYAFLLGYPILGLWYWCTDQTIVQRVLGARTEKDAQLGALFAGLLKILPLFLMVLPGVFAYVLYHELIGDQAAQTLPVLITQLVPTGIRGVIAAALLAALMSTIAAALNSTGTLVAKDIAKHVRPDLSDEAQVRIGRISAVVVMLLAMLWSTQGGRFGSIFEAINKMPAQFIAPPIATVLLWGVFWRRGTRQAGVFTLALGFGGGLILFVLDLGLGVFGGKQWVTEGLQIPFMMQAWWLFCILSVFYVFVSLLTQAPSLEQVKDITWERPGQVLFHGKLTGVGDPRVVAGMLLVAMAVLYALLR
jgi:SSS family solute:Na+ symporter